MENKKLLTMQIGDIVKTDYRTAEIFKKHNIDFCCGGNKTLQNACETENIDLKTIQKELNQVNETASTTSEIDFSNLELDSLVDHIITTHHNYVRQNIPILLEYCNKIARVHGENHPEIVEISHLFREIAGELQPHMMKEEMMLFPFIKKLYNASLSENALNESPFGTVKNPIGAMVIEHERAGDLLKNIRDLSSNFTLPQDSCNTYRVAYSKLEEFEADLHKHIHLENNILFPRAVELEERLLT